MKNEKIFDLNSLDDLPDGYRQSITRKKIAKESHIKELFNHKDELSLDEIMVGMFRLYGIIKGRSTIYSALGTLVNKKQLVTHKEGSDRYWKLAIKPAPKQSQNK